MKKSLNVLSKIVNQITGPYMKCNLGLKYVKEVVKKLNKALT